MSSKTKSVTAVLIVLALVAGVGMTKVGSKYKTQDKVNLIFANATSNSAKKAGEKFKELVEEYSDGDITVDLFPDNQLGDDKTVAEGVQNGDIDIGISSSGNLSTLYKDYYIYDTPYLFLNSQEGKTDSVIARIMIMRLRHRRIVKGRKSVQWKIQFI